MLGSVLALAISIMYGFLTGWYLSEGHPVVGFVYLLVTCLWAASAGYLFVTRKD